MKDRELLELAAKAGGIEGEYECWAGQGFKEGIRQVLDGAKCRRVWSPLTGNGDALRLAVDSGIDVSPPSKVAPLHAVAQWMHWDTQE